MNWKNYNLVHWNKKDVSKTLTIESLTIQLLKLDMTLMSPGEGRKNLIAIDTGGEIVWIAELPKIPYTTYSDIKIIDGKLFGWADSTLCEIDAKTGKILSEEFVK